MNDKKNHLMQEDIQQNQPSGTSSYFEMPDKPLHQRVLERSLPYLVDKLNPHPLLDYLVAEEVLPQSIASDIKEKRKISDVITELIHCIKTRDESLFLTVKEGLKSTGQGELAEKLNAIETDLNIEIKADQTSADSDSEFSDAPDHVEPIEKDSNIDRIIQKFGLENKMDQKIQVSDVVQLDVFENADKQKNDQDLPFIFLQHILSGNSGAFNYKSYLPGDDSGSSKFDQSMMFMNARGDFNTEKNFSVSDRDFINSVTDTVVVILDLMTFLSHTTSLGEQIQRFSSVLLLFVGEIRVNDDTKTKLKDFETNVINHSKLNLHIIATHTGMKERNSTDIVADVKFAICKFVHEKEFDLKTFGSRVGKSIKTDETSCCKEAYQSAKLLIAEIGKISPETHIIEKVTPVQSKITKLLGTLIKDSYSNSSLCAFDDQTKKIPQARLLKREQITSVIKIFSKSLVQNRNRCSFLQLYLSSLKLLLERRKRLAPQNLFDMSKTFDTEENAFLEIEHLFREIAHICDSIEISGTSSESIDFPHVNELVDVVSSLMVQGYSFELLDAEHFFIPTEWIKLILSEVNRKINEKQLLVLSVLGVQSSGKSTLLNTMFGFQFPTSCGRCTRGIHMRLVPLVKRKNELSTVPFDYILVIDTEGIRAPECLDTQETYYQRDNKLSTIIVGLGDVTILNVMGESISEMHDILQILAHAFLRLKLANNSLDIRKSCFLIHQNVSEMQAPMKLKAGLTHALQILDKATKEAAEFEGISDITTFHDVIKFERESNVFYFPNLWHGNPPMASINRMYCDRVNVLTTRLFKESLHDRGKSFKTLEDIATHVHDLWKGVLAENFIFSFRNNIEKKAYIEMEKFIRDTFWLLESSFDDESLQMVQKRFSKCDDHDSLKRTLEEIPLSIKELISKHKQKAFDKMEVFFQGNKYKEMLVRWKEQSLNRLDMFCKIIDDNRNMEIATLYKKRKVDIMITMMCIKHKDQLRRKSLELANELRASGTTIDKNEKIARFEHIWETIVTESLSFVKTQPEKSSLRDDCIFFLHNVFGSQSALLNRFLKGDTFDEGHELKHLSGSFVKTEIDISDISMSKKKIVKSKKNEKNSSEKFEEKLKLVQCATENLFLTIDTRVELTCQRNEIITNRDLKQVLNDTFKSVKEISTNQSHHFTMKITYQIKVLVHVSKYLCRRFEAENIEHLQSHSITARLDTYRKQMQERFFAYLEERKAEDTAVCLMHGMIENLLSENIKENLTRKVKFVLKFTLPQLKYDLLIAILTELMENDDFDQFKSYILSPKDHAYLWVNQKAKRFLFSQSTVMYSGVAEREITNLFQVIEHNLKKSTTNFQDNKATIENWIETFKSLNDTFTFPNDCFNNVAREFENLECIQIVDFVNKIIDKLDQTKASLIDMYRNVTEETIRWNGCNPVDKLFEDIWGCSEQCMFCGEPCIKSKQHDTCHMCLQHRPLGISGVFDEGTGDIFLTSCHVNVTGDGNVPCTFINFRCNPQKRNDCKDKRHKFQDYKSIVSTWDIEPVRLMEDCSLFWMWFMGKYKQQLGEYYHINTENIPSTWNEIQEKRALDSLCNLRASNIDRIGSVLK
ncbi:interferon-induced very large GTPase 1-like [Ruditapes philippinarum]|uniref:interferon-induced very large GTPase 1-like n=1 Tax=Ruditapes philippinarum TaxID=129788 RepID=UPI00295AE598|nr:interferon-induced very large GTPase 1-like [Ruditapes philippinarum]